MKGKLIYKTYEEKLPRELTQYDGNLELGNGLIRLCAPDEYADLLSEGYEEKNAIIFAITAFGDLIVWEKDKYVNLVGFSDHKVTVLESGFDFTFEDLNDESFLKKYLDYDLFLKVKEKIGMPDKNECYVFSPIPAISGIKSSENVKIGKVKEYIGICTELLGKIK